VQHTRLIRVLLSLCQHRRKLIERDEFLKRFSTEFAGCITQNMLTGRVNLLENTIKEGDAEHIAGQFQQQVLFVDCLVRRATTGEHNMDVCEMFGVVKCRNQSGPNKPDMGLAELNQRAETPRQAVSASRSTQATAPGLAHP